ncbi:hypothetical protein HU200_052848 [Digitaria exilis]|uniref:Uncharacterized protein n=1 Tax=Digitaria exilis TaxID=1010633 RepID=A0A835AIM2_9POAL|nr:hypothetical protein HU200_052848 [Digitaria exilis]
MIINRYVRFRTRVMLVFKAVGSLALLWSAAVHLGGFVSWMKQEDFWYLTVIGFIQAAGLVLHLSSVIMSSILFPNTWLSFLAYMRTGHVKTLSATTLLTMTCAKHPVHHPSI